MRHKRTAAQHREQLVLRDRVARSFAITADSLATRNFLIRGRFIVRKITAVALYEPARAMIRG